MQGCLNTSEDLIITRAGTSAWLCQSVKAEGPAGEPLPSSSLLTAVPEEAGVWLGQELYYF